MRKHRKLNKLPSFYRNNRGNNRKHKHRKYDRNYQNTILARTISARLLFEDRVFFNVNLRGARLRKIEIDSGKFILCDFPGAIFNKGKFRRVTFKKCVFVATIFRDCRFEDSTFEKCYFINTNVKELEPCCKFIDCHHYNHNGLRIPSDIDKKIEFTRARPIFQENRLLHIKGGKINKTTLFIILQKLRPNIFINNLQHLCEVGEIDKIYTTMRLLECLVNVTQQNSKDPKFLKAGSPSEIIQPQLQADT